jgi:hypothetical protein
MTMTVLVESPDPIERQVEAAGVYVQRPGRREILKTRR